MKTYTGLSVLTALTLIPNTRMEVDYKAFPRAEYKAPCLVHTGVISCIVDKEQMKDYIEEFNQRFGEAPIFSIEGNKIAIENKIFKDWRDKSFKIKCELIEEESKKAIYEKICKLELLNKDEYSSLILSVGLKFISEYILYPSFKFSFSYMLSNFLSGYAIATFFSALDTVTNLLELRFNI